MGLSLHGDELVRPKIRLPQARLDGLLFPQQPLQHVRPLNNWNIRLGGAPGQQQLADGLVAFLSGDLQGCPILCVDSIHQGAVCEKLIADVRVPSTRCQMQRHLVPGIHYVQSSASLQQALHQPQGTTLGRRMQRGAAPDIRIMHCQRAAEQRFAGDGVASKCRIHELRHGLLGNLSMIFIILDGCFCFFASRCTLGFSPALESLQDCQCHQHLEEVPERGAPHLLG
mmetsp:Transcript_125178/g.400966  ORF Transcript_125178/g.400966 Transcript_125178/m.400966 type:complete len:227 (+) Transcript_125178:168-848(+)